MYKIAIYEDELIKLKRIEYVVRQIALMNNLKLEVMIFQSKEKLLEEKHRKFDFIIDGKNKKITQSQRLNQARTYNMSNYYIEGRIIDIEAFSDNIVKMIEEYKKDNRLIQRKDSKSQSVKYLITMLKDRLR